jgi:hypothetical protein
MPVNVDQEDLQDLKRWQEEWERDQVDAYAVFEALAAGPSGAGAGMGTPSSKVERNKNRVTVSLGRKCSRSRFVCN